jgi:osmoprotectant transport system ATP-binding protein
LIALEDVSKRYGTQVALARTTVRFPAAATTALIGPSGCGKSTLLRLIVGLIEPTSGAIVIGGETLQHDNVDRLRHRIGYVIQDGGLFPHLTARDNVTLLARHLDRTRVWIEDRVAALTALMQLPPALLDRFPRSLSGGQRQRVSLMRALMLDPPVLLLDEPLGALDPVTRFRLQEQLKALFSTLKKTTLLVTHDMTEAAYLADEIAVMRDGAILQRGSLAQLLREPADEYVREFFRAQRRTLPEVCG